MNWRRRWRPHYLFSVATPGHGEMLGQCREKMGETILDCGAFSYFQRGLPTPNVLHHTRYALDLQDKYGLDYLVQLDVIRDVQKTIENYRYQRKFGFCPVLTVGQEVETVPEEDRNRLLFLSYSREAAQRRSVAEHLEIKSVCPKIHIFGMARKSVIDGVLPYSCDTTEVAITTRRNYSYYLSPGTGHAPVHRPLATLPHNLVFIHAFCMRNNLAPLYKSIMAGIKFPANKMPLPQIDALNKLTAWEFYREVEKKTGTKIFNVFYDGDHHGFLSDALEMLDRTPISRRMEK